MTTLLAAISLLCAALPAPVLAPPLAGAGFYSPPVNSGTDLTGTDARGAGYLHLTRPRSLFIGHPSTMAGHSSVTPADIEWLAEFWSHDLRAGLADVFGWDVLTPDQERAVAVLQKYPRTCFYGGSGTGKSRIIGGVVALSTAIHYRSKATFGGPKLDSAALLSWQEFQKAHDAARERGLSLGGTLKTYEWQGSERDWFAQVMAMSERDNAAGVAGMMHAYGHVWAVLEEMNGIHPTIRDRLYGGTTQTNWHMVGAFNPVDKNDAAGQYLAATPPEAVVQFSALACAEWQVQTGHIIPGMPTLEAIAEKWRGKENDPLYYAYVLGEFPPESADWVVLPQTWYDRLTNAIPVPFTRDKQRPCYGLDTGGGSSETALATVLGRIVLPVQAIREQHQTPVVCARVREALSRNGDGPVAVDYVGLGGKGVGDDLTPLGIDVRPFVGGGREFSGADCPDLYANNIAWAWFNLRERARRSIIALDEGRPEGVELSLPPDPVLREQLARRYEVNNERRYKLEEKEPGNSPDRADAVCMALLAQDARPVVDRRVAVPATAFVPELTDIEEQDTFGAWARKGEDELA